MADKEVSELRFGLSFDGSKLKASIEETCKKVQESFKKSFENGAEAATKAVETGNAEIDAILQDTERSAKSKAASISAIYQKMGMSQSEAMKKAWSYIERDSESGAKKVNKHASSILEKMKNAFSGIKKNSKSTKDSIGKDIDSTSASADKMSSKLSAAAKKIMVALAGAFAVSSLISFGKSCIDLGSDLAEVQNVVDVTFGDMSDKVNEYAKAAMKNVGLSETMAKQFTGNYGAMAKAFGFTTEQAYEMSTSLTTLAGDVASFYNLDQETAYTKLKSVFTGETESLKELGVVMTQTALDSYALANGYGKTTSAMTEAEKVSLRFAFVTDTLSSSSGDFIRTAGGWANQMRVLNLQFDSFKATIGQGLINALTPALQMLNRLMEKANGLAESFKNLTEQIFGFSNGGGSTSAAASDMASVAEAAADTESSLESASRYLAGFDAMTKVSSSSSGGVSAVAADSGTSTASTTSVIDETVTETAFDRMLATLKQKFNKFVSGLPQLKFNVDWKYVKDKLISSFKKDIGTLGNIGKTVITIGIDFLNDVDVGQLIEKFAQLKDSASGLAKSFTGAIGPACVTFYETAISPLVQWIGEKLADAIDECSEIMDSWAGWFDEHADKINEFAGKLGEVAAGFWSLIEPIADAAWETFKGILEEINTALQSFFSWILDHQDETIAAIVGITTALIAYQAALSINSLIQAFQRALNGATLAEKAAAAGQALLNAVMNANPIALVVAGLAGLAAGLTYLWNNCEWFRNLWIGLWEKLQGAFSAAWSAITTGLSKAKEFFGGVASGIRSAFESIPQWFEDKFTAAWTKVKNVFSKGGEVFAGIKDGILSELKSVINGLIGGINNVISVPFNGINDALNMIKDINILGAKPFGGLPNIEVPQIPMLANGGYVKANTPQLAMIGDNRHQGEIVSPESKLLDMAYQAASMAGGDSSLLKQIISLLEQLISIVQDGSDIVLMVDGEELARANAKGAMSLKRRYTTTDVEFA